MGVLKLTNPGCQPSLRLQEKFRESLSGPNFGFKFWKNKPQFEKITKNLGLEIPCFPFGKKLALVGKDNMSEFKMTGE